MGCLNFINIQHCHFWKLIYLNPIQNCFVKLLNSQFNSTIYH